MIKKLKKQNTWGECLEKLNEVVDAVNRHEDIIRQIGEWGSRKGECLWCENITKVNLDSDWYDEQTPAKNARPPYMQSKRLRKALGIAQSALVKLANDAYAMDEHIYIEKILNQIERITKGGDNE